MYIFISTNCVFIFILAQPLPQDLINFSARDIVYGSCSLNIYIVCACIIDMNDTVSSDQVNMVEFL